MQVWPCWFQVTTVCSSRVCDVVGVAFARHLMPGRAFEEGLAGDDRVPEPRSIRVAVVDRLHGAPGDLVLAGADRLPAEFLLPVGERDRPDPGGEDRWVAAVRRRRRPGRRESGRRLDRGQGWCFGSLPPLVATTIPAAPPPQPRWRPGPRVTPPERRPRRRRPWPARARARSTRAASAAPRFRRPRRRSAPRPSWRAPARRRSAGCHLRGAFKSSLPLWTPPEPDSIPRATCARARNSLEVIVASFAPRSSAASP